MRHCSFVVNLKGKLQRRIFNRRVPCYETMISNLENIKTIFKKMSADNWDIDNELTWGFFFVDKDDKKLRNVFEELKEKEYKIVKLERGEDGLWILMVSKREVLTPEKLHKRNLAFNDLADHCDIELYDGWDVEK